MSNIPRTKETPMGGINHSPTSNVSIALTVPAAESLTQAMAELMLGNVSIERLVQLSGGTNFGVGRQRLIEALARFERVVAELQITRSYVHRVVDTIGNNEYNPFDLSTVDIDSLIPSAIDAGMLPDAKAVTDAVNVIKHSGYSGVFFAIDDLIEVTIAKAHRLVDTTKPMIDGPEGTQGYFWANVEANKNTWRQDFMAVLTSMNNLISFWATTAVVCTEAHLIGVSTPGLLSNISTNA